ncbi:MAG: zinc-ribbon domain-containing protein [Gemmatimonadota bacterium]
MNVRCPECSKVYRVDPQRLPAGGVRTRCTECGALFGLGAGGVEAVVQPAVAPDPPVQEQPAAAPGPAPSVDSPAPPSEAAPPAAAVFGPQDPKTRARRLARALVSDIVVYHPDRRERSLKGGTLRREFREEILKSWDEYVEQVGEEMAKKTPFFRDALNEILAKGQKVF